VAKAFSRLKKPPERSVLFILFAGEEKGLFGSRYYVSHPLFPLDRTAAMLNLDMIGRNGTDSLSLVGAPVSPDIAAIARKENRKTKLTLTDDSDFLGGSDHYPFYRKKIPFMFFFSGIHRDYHTPADNPDRIDCPKAARVSQLVFRTALSIADSDEHYRVIEREENFNIFE
jgi:Zn-dependent M28 family amino/carboxypeptidase